MAKIKVRYGKHTYPYSVGAVVESLQGAGLSTDLAIQIARDLEKSYSKENIKLIRLEQLVNRLANIIEKETDQRTAQRFRDQTPPFVPIRVVLKDKSSPFSERYPH